MKRTFFLPWVVAVLASCSLVSVNLMGGSLEPRMVINHYPQRTNRGVLEWDCPVFASYKNGTVIWRRHWAQSIDALVTVKSATADSLVKRLGALVAAYDGKTFRLTASSDPEGTTIWYLGKRVEIVGPWEKPHTIELSDAGQAAAVNESERKLWATFPQDMRDALAAVAAFDEAGSSAWRPEELDVTLMAAGKALGDAVAWPDQWPRAFEDVPGNPGLTRAKLPGAMLDELLGVLSKDGKPRPVLFGAERKYARIAIVFPGEAAWRQSH